MRDDLRKLFKSLSWLEWCLIPLFIGGMIYLYFHDPRVPGSTPACIYRTISGFHCPGCGITRSVYCLMHGMFWQAIDFNPLAMIMIPFFMYEGVLEVRRRIGYAKKPGLFNRRVPAIILVVVVLIYWIVRNLPFAPFTFLAP